MNHESFLPDCYQKALSFFSIIDQCYCFLIKAKLRTTTKHLSNLYTNLVSLTDLKDDDIWKEFTMQKLQLLATLCGQEVLLEDYTDESGVTFSVFSFKTLCGAGKGHIAGRRKMVVEALWNLALEEYKRQFNLPFLDKKTIASIRKKGWPVDFDTTKCSLPIHQPNVFESSGTASRHSLEDEMLAELIRKDPVDLSVGSYSDLLSNLSNQPFYKGQIEHLAVFPPKVATYAELERALPSELEHCLRRHLNCENFRFYRHQALGINAIRRNKHVIICTSTASGKSLVYNLPVMETLMTTPSATALYLFPTKALAQDQLRCLHEFIGGNQALRTVPMVCDGDTPVGDRVNIQQAVGNILFTNPDMLHYTLLPDHHAWKRIFSQLKYVVIDEAHNYRYQSCVMSLMCLACLINR